VTGYDHDLIVIGSGGAAMAAGIAARARGADVLLVERGTLGGTCLNVGCVPSKTLLAAAGRRSAAKANPFSGVPTGEVGAVDLRSLVDQKDRLIEAMRQAKYAEVAAAHGFEIRSGNARFADPDTLLVDGEPLTARAYLIATGADPALPDLPGLDGVEVLTSTTAMELTALPGSLLVIGGGYVGMEQAQIFAGLGTHVTLVGRLAPHTEPELREVMRGAFARAGITVVQQRAVAVQALGGGAAVVTDGGGRWEAERLLVATGRVPRSADLDPAAGSVGLDSRGFVLVDDRQRTSNPRVWAAGDVSGAPQFVYVAAATGRVAAQNALGGDTWVHWAGLPAVTFTRPQIAGAGLTEQQARDAGYDCDCRVLGARDISRALVEHAPLGALKLVADAATGKVLGVHAALDGAGEMMLAATYAITAGMTVDDLADTWAPYLTVAEGLRIAAGLYRSDKPTSCCA